MAIKDKTDLDEIRYINLNNVTQVCEKDNFLTISFVNGTQRLYNYKLEPLKIDFIKSKLSRKFLTIRTEEYYRKIKI